MFMDAKTKADLEFWYDRLGIQEDIAAKILCLLYSIGWQDRHFTQSDEHEKLARLETCFLNKKKA